jgi:two-component system sensor kinase FixL
MASTLAHELNQPLAAIGNYAAGSRRALEVGGQSEAVAGSIVAIERCALRAGNIIRSLRTITRESTSMRQTIDVGPLVREAAALAIAAGGEAVKLDLDLADGLKVSADPVQIQQVIVNLVRNAIEAVQGSNQREIAIAAAIAGGEVRIQVDDSGPGIPPELIESLFESFVTSKPDGMGVGLSISRTIVEAHGGRISGANRAGGGASFRVALPAAGRDLK